MNVISFSSRVCHGYVGHSASVPLLQAMGIDIWAIDTITMGHHPGFGPSRRVLSPEVHITESVRDVCCRVDRISAIITGYFASSEQVECTAQCIETCLDKDSSILVMVDPIMGDDDHLYVVEETALAIERRLIPLANIITPNVFELGRLSSERLDDRVECERVARAFSKLRNQCVIVTSMQGPSGHRNTVFAVDGDQTAHAETSWRDNVQCKGTGDAFAALMLGFILQGRSMECALQAATHELSELIHLSCELKRQDLAIPQWLNVKRPDLSRGSQDS